MCKPHLSFLTCQAPKMTAAVVKMVLHIFTRTICSTACPFAVNYTSKEMCFQIALASSEYKHRTIPCQCISSINASFTNKLFHMLRWLVRQSHSSQGSTLHCCVVCEVCTSGCICWRRTAAREDCRVRLTNQSRANSSTLTQINSCATKGTSTCISQHLNYRPVARPVGWACSY